MSAKKSESAFDKEVEPSSKPSKAARASAAFYKRSIVISITLTVILLLTLGAGIYYYTQYKHTQQLLSNPNLSAQVDAENLIKKVGSLIDLPKNENPQIAIVSDEKKVKTNPFFVNAKKGYKVLIYLKAKKAILYDPVNNKIINVGPINIGTAEQNTASPSALPTSSIAKVVILNGTKTVGLATVMEKNLIEQDKNVLVVSKGNASTAYPKTIVVDLTGAQASRAAQIAAILKGDVGKLPAGEVKPANADMLIILGGK